MNQSIDRSTEAILATLSEESAGGDRIREAHRPFKVLGEESAAPTILPPPWLDARDLCPWVVLQAPLPLGDLKHGREDHEEAYEVGVRDL